MANELGSIDKTWSFPEWQYKVKRMLVLLKHERFIDKTRNRK
jgi:hypothetical protein